MPRYEFYCEDCKKPFEVLLSLVGVRKGQDQVSEVWPRTHPPGGRRVLRGDLEEKLKLGLVQPSHLPDQCTRATKFVRDMNSR